MEMIKYKVWFVNMYGLGLHESETLSKESPKEIFENIWVGLPEPFRINWIWIQFEFDGLTYEVDEKIFAENYFSFEQSHKIIGHE